MALAGSLAFALADELLDHELGERIITAREQGRSFPDIARLLEADLKVSPGMLSAETVRRWWIDEIRRRTDRPRSTELVD